MAGILEEFADKGYQFCVIDPEGDFENFAGALPIGSPSDPPDPNVVAKALESPQNLVVNLMNVPMSETTRRVFRIAAKNSGNAIENCSPTLPGNRRSAPLAAAVMVAGVRHDSEQ